jgi:hypothetical protein
MNWTFRGLNPEDGEICGNNLQRPPTPPPPSLLYNGSIPGVKRRGRGIDNPPPQLAQRLKKVHNHVSVPPLWAIMTYYSVYRKLPFSSELRRIVTLIVSFLLLRPSSIINPTLQFEFLLYWCVPNRLVIQFPASSVYMCEVSPRAKLLRWINEMFVPRGYSVPFMQVNTV